jgi:hypothetical protein
VIGAGDTVQDLDLLLLGLVDFLDALEDYVLLDVLVFIHRREDISGVYHHPREAIRALVYLAGFTIDWSGPQT